MIFCRQYGWAIIENLVVFIIVGNILGCAKDIESLLFHNCMENFGINAIIWATNICANILLFFTTIGSIYDYVLLPEQHMSL